MSPCLGIMVNTRSLTAGLTGVQRYTTELAARYGEQLSNVAPTRPMQGIKGHLWEQLRLPNLVRKHLLWSPANSGPITVGRQVVTIHDIAVLDHPEWFNPRFVAWYRWMTPRLVRRASRVIAVSYFTKRRLVEVTGIDESRIEVVHNGVDSRFRPRPPEEVQEMRHALGIPSTEYVLSLSTLEPRKNLIGQLEAWGRCVDQLPKQVWLVVAGAKGKDHVFNSTQSHAVPPRVHFTGSVSDEDLPALYSGALAFLYPSFYEGFGLPILEAMAAGTVPILSRGSGPSEVAGDAGIVVDPHDPDTIASAILRIVKDPCWRQELSNRARLHSVPFSWDRAASSTWRVLEEAANN